MTQQKQDESRLSANPGMVSINGSQVKIVRANNHMSALIESQDQHMSREALEYQEQLRQDILNQTLNDQLQPRTSLFNGVASMDEFGLHLQSPDIADQRKIVIVADNCDLSSYTGSQV